MVVGGTASSRPLNPEGCIIECPRARSWQGCILPLDFPGASRPCMSHRQGRRRRRLKKGMQGSSTGEDKKKDKGQNRVRGPVRVGRMRSQIYFVSRLLLPFLCSSKMA